MQVPKFLLDEEKAKKFFTHSVAFATGSIVASLLAVRDMKKFTAKLKARNELIKTYRDEIRRIQNDVSLSGAEREEKVETIIKFVDLVLDQPID